MVFLSVRKAFSMGRNQSAMTGARPESFNMLFQSAVNLSMDASTLGVP